jgi:putative metallohydrolase (TIGR04338 family)
VNCQQGKLYAAEEPCPEGHRFASIDDVQRFVDSLRDTWWWRLWYPQVQRVEVHALPAGRSCSVGSWHPQQGAGKLEMLRVHWTVRVVLHELAHVLAEVRYGSHAHCPWFARTYLELVYLVMGAETFTFLRTAFRAADVDFTPPYEPRLGDVRRLPPCSD